MSAAAVGVSLNGPYSAILHFLPRHEGRPTHVDNRNFKIGAIFRRSQPRATV